MVSGDMETGGRTRWAYWALIAVLAASAAALGYAYSEKDREAERLAAAQRALAQELQAARAGASALETEVTTLQQKNAELIAEMEKLARGLSETERKASAAAEARAELSRELQAKEQTLEQAKARSAELNKAYESLLQDKSRLAASDAAHRAELERTRRAFEEVQGVIAKLTGARGIYTVQHADSLSSIAAFFYRDGHRWPDVFEANSHLIDHPDLIYPEQVLIVPH